MDLRQISLVVPQYATRDKFLDPLNNIKSITLALIIINS